MEDNKQYDVIRQELERLQQVNPVARSWAQGRSVDSLVMTRDRPLNNLQRLGILILMFPIGGGAALMLGGDIEDIRDGDVLMGTLMRVVGLGGVCFALRAIWRVWWDVFKRPAQQEDEHRKA